MRLIKLFGLAAITAVVGMAFMGVSSAMAEELDPLTVICKSDVLLCPQAEILPAGSIITAVALEGENAPVLLGAINEKCEKSTIKTELVTADGQPLKGKEPAGGGLSFTECKPCTKVTASAPEGSLEMAGEPEPGDHHWTLTSSGSTLFEGCPFGVKCKFEGTVELLAHNDLALGGLLVLAEEEELKLAAGFSKLLCGESGKWDAHYIAEGHWLSSTKLP